MIPRRLAIVFAMAGSIAGCRAEEKRPTEGGAAVTQTAPVVPALPDDPYVRARIEMTRRLAGSVTRDPAVLTAIRLTPRDAFVPPAVRSQAYDDRPLAIGYGLTISAPAIVAIMSEAAQIKPGAKVLEIGTGSGYQAAVLAMMGAEVYTMEIHEELAERTRKVLDSSGFSIVKTRIGDGWYGWPEAAPFDAILVTCGAPILSSWLLDQLKPETGRLVIPFGEADQQTLEVIRRTDNGLDRTRLLDVRFGPMTGVVETQH